MDTRQSTFKNTIANLVVLCLVLLFSVSVSASLSGFETVEENDYLTLYFNKDTTEIAVKDKINDKMWFSNPQDRDTVRAAVRNRLNSQVVIYHGAGSGTEKDSYKYSIQYDQFDYSLIDQGVRVNYQIVEEWRVEHYVPVMLSYERMHNYFLANLEDKRHIRDIIDSYDLIQLVPLGDQEREPISGLNLDLIFGDYIVEVLNQDYLDSVDKLMQDKVRLVELEEAIAQGDESLITQRDRLERDINRLKQRLDRQKQDIIWRLLYAVEKFRGDLLRLEDICLRDLEGLIENPTYVLQDVPGFVIQDMKEIMESIEITPIEVMVDHQMYGLDPHLANLEVFSVSIEYTLDGPNLLVRVPSGDIKYPIDVEDRYGQKHTIPVQRIAVLEYFGAANLENEGYMLVPDGSGALIYLNNGRVNNSAFAAIGKEYIYGCDYALDPSSDRIVYPESMRLPVFGMVRDDQAFFAIIEAGAALGNIRADISGKIHNYNRVFAEFTTTPVGVVSREAVGAVWRFQEEIYQGDFVIRYCFLAGDDASYSGMARLYRQYLMEKYQLEKRPTLESIPFYLELIGAIDKRKPVLGVARDVIYPLTTFRDTQIMLQDLIDHGISNVTVKYNGWLNGGLKHDYPSKAKIEKVVGTEGELLDLKEFMDAKGFALYPSVGLLNVYRNTLFNGFSPRKDAAVHVNQLPAYAWNYNLDLYTRSEQSHMVLSPSKLDGLVDEFLKNYKRYGIDNISIFDIAREISSDFREDALIDRVKSQDIIVEQLEKFKDNQMQIMVDYGNAYAIPFATTILNMPTRTSNRNITDIELPLPNGDSWSSRLCWETN